ncbi:MAG: aminopeptidase P N-terminal domain-containing protein [Bacteriovoracaceae bacterium]|nr:aminopeptidase P N-terminal domain-containing protein [Bacteroidota bacterium]
MRVSLFFLFAVTFCALAQQNDGLKYIQYDTDVISPAEYKMRRDSVMKMIGLDAAAVFYSSPERMRNGDVDYLYRQADNFYYLTGFTEPNAMLVLSPKGIRVKVNDSTLITTNEALFVQSKNLQAEAWTGRRYGTDGAMQMIGVQTALNNERFKSVFQQVMYSGIKYLYAQPVTSDVTGPLKDLLSPIISYVDNAKRYNSKIELRDPNAMVHTMRIIKSKPEIAMLRKASEISAIAHNQAMSSVEPGMFEYEVQALYEYAFQRQGSEYNGYPCINGSAENSVILHYNTNRKKINSGDIVLSDCAAEYHGYSSDVTRSYPASGKFTKEQKEIYQIVLNAQKAAMAQIKPGIAWNDVSAVADSVIAEGLFSLGIIKKKEGMGFKKFYNHGLGHPVGLNVHDVGQSVLATGMAYTVEPGIYIPETSDGVDPKYFNIGIRVEDVIVVTETGNENLSAGSPREIAEIEALMKKKGIGNQPLK